MGKNSPTRKTREPARVSLAVTLLLLTACVSNGERPQDDDLYIIPVPFDATRLLSPPPDDETGRTRDLAAVRAAQQARTAEQAALAESSSSVDLFLFSSVLGPHFVRERLPQTARFFSRVYRSTFPILNAAKECWSRPRPFVVDKTLTPLERSLASTRSRSEAAGAQRQVAAASMGGAATAAANHATPEAGDSPCVLPSAGAPYSYSYPSGHATVGAMTAILLAEMVPERRVDLFALGWEYGDARVVSGVHFPSDIEAGRILGTMLVSMMQRNARFRADLRTSRRELRAALGYP